MKKYKQYVYLTRFSIVGPVDVVLTFAYACREIRFSTLVISLLILRGLGILWLGSGFIKTSLFAMGVPKWPGSKRRLFFSLICNRLALFAAGYILRLL